MRELLDKVLIDVDDPVCGHPAMSAIRLSEDVFLSCLSHSYVVELPPLLVEVIPNESIVVAGVGVSIMDANCMQMVGIVVHASIGLLDLLVQPLQLALH